MLQSFEEMSEPDQGPKRLAALRQRMSETGVDAYIVPRADAYQGEYVAECDARLAWLTGFTGSAGFCVILQDEAGVFVDGRYRVQVRAQTDPVAYTPVDWPETKAGPWLVQRMKDGQKLGFDPWLHTIDDVSKLEETLGSSGISLVPIANLVDDIWVDRPSAPKGKAVAHPIELAGETSGAKRKRMAADLKQKGHRGVVLTEPASISWLLNIRGTDLPRVPIVQSHAVLHDDARVWLFSDPSKFDDLGPDPAIEIFPHAEMVTRLGTMNGPVRLEKSSCPVAVLAALATRGIETVFDNDPCSLPKACKNPVEIEGARTAHLRDAVAMVKFLHWLDERAPGGTLTEIDTVVALEGFRRENNSLLDISFETIAGTAGHAALPHYRVSTSSNAPVTPGNVLLVDSGGQYRDGTTDITRTVAIGDPGPEARQAFTRVLQGMIAISRLRFPRGLAGRDLDAIARFPLWTAGQDYDHGTGHGVGSYLSVHEGPHRLSRTSEVPFAPGMIVSNEPGYYREGAFGIRIENLIVVQDAPKLDGADDRDHLAFETLTYVPIDTRMILPEMMSPQEVTWLNTYHADVVDKIGPLVDGAVRAWLVAATRPI